MSNDMLISLYRNIFWDCGKWNVGVLMDRARKNAAAHDAVCSFILL